MSNSRLKIDEDSVEKTIREIRAVLNRTKLSDPERLIVLKDVTAGEETRQAVALQSMIVLNALNNIR